MVELMLQSFSIHDSKIGGARTFIIAEAGVNHNGDIDLAKELIVEAKRAKVDAIKFQTFRTDELVTKYAPKADYQQENTKSDETQFDMIKRLELPFKAFEELNVHAENKKLLFLSTPFDLPSVKFLINLGVPAFKVGSGDMNNTLLLDQIIAANSTLLYVELDAKQNLDGYTLAIPFEKSLFLSEIKFNGVSIGLDSVKILHNGNSRYLLFYVNLSEEIQNLEIKFQTSWNPLPTDLDNDGVLDIAESSFFGTSQEIFDTDNDNVSDGDEIFIYKSNPTDGIITTTTSVSNPLSSQFTTSTGFPSTSPISTNSDDSSSNPTSVSNSTTNSRTSSVGIGIMVIALTPVFIIRLSRKRKL